jgi:hypothetical protein
MFLSINAHGRKVIDFLTIFSYYYKAFLFTIYKIRGIAGDVWEKERPGVGIVRIHRA